MYGDDLQNEPRNKNEDNLNSMSITMASQVETKLNLSTVLGPQPLLRTLHRNNLPHQG